MPTHPALAAAARYTRTALADLLESDDMSVRVRRGSEHLRARVYAAAENSPPSDPRGWLAAAAEGALREDGETAHTLVAALAAAIRPRDVEEPPPTADEPQDPTPLEWEDHLRKELGVTAGQVADAQRGEAVADVPVPARQTRAVPPARARVLVALDREDALAAGRAGHRWPSSSWLPQDGGALPSWVYLTNRHRSHPAARGVLAEAGRGARGHALLAGPSGGALEVVVTEAASKALGWHSGRHIMADDVAVVAEAAGLDRARVRFRLL